MDELAAAAQQDPVRYRRAAEGAAHARGARSRGRSRRMGHGLPAGSGRGVSIQFAFGSYLAQVAEVAVNAQGQVRVERVVCAMDCGKS